MLMRSSAHFTGESVMSRPIEATDRLTIRERIVETEDWTIAVPAIATLSVTDERQGSLYQGALLAAAAISAVAGLANYALSAVAPALPILVAALALTAIFALLSVRGKRRFVLALTTSDGSRCTVASENIAELNDIRAFLAEKINRQDCGAIRVFQLNSASQPDAKALPGGEALHAITEHTAATTVHAAGDARAVLSPDTVLANPAPRPEGGSTDYASVLGQITDLHRFYEKHPQAVHIRERLSEMELLMRSGTPSQAQRTRVRELALDLTNIMSAYPHMTQLFNHVTSLAGR
jgi:hypothetical protein